MTEAFQAHTAVESVIWQGRSCVYEPAVVVTSSNGNYTIKLLKDGSLASCSAATLRLRPPPSVLQLSNLDPGDPVDVFEHSTLRWRAMVAMHSAGLPVSEHTSLLLLQPDNLDIFAYTKPKLRRGLVYTSSSGGSPWQPRPVEPACIIISSKTAVSGKPWTYVGVRPCTGQGEPSAGTAEEAAATAAAGRPVRYKGRIKNQRQHRVTHLESTRQAVAARARDLWTGTRSNLKRRGVARGGFHVQVQISQHLQLTKEEEPRLLLGAPAVSVSRSQAEPSQGQAAASGVGTKRSQPQDAADDTPPAKRTATQQQQHPMPSATNSKQDQVPAASSGSVSAGTHSQRAEQQHHGLDQQVAAAAPKPTTPPTAALKAAAGGGSAADGCPPAPAAPAEASLGRLSLQQLEQQQQPRAGSQLAGVGGVGQQVVVRSLGVSAAAAGGRKGGASSAAAAGGMGAVPGGAAAAEAAAGAGAPAAAVVTSGVVEVWQPGQVVRLTLMSLDKVPVSLGTYTLRVVRKLGFGGQCSVWLVELLEGGGSSSSSAAPGPPAPAAAAGGGAGAAGAASQAHASSSNPSGAAASTAPAEAAATYKPMSHLMAVKVAVPYDLAPADHQASMRRDQYNAITRQLMIKECDLLAKCGECDAIVDTFGWGMAQLPSPGPQQQQQSAPSAAAAAGSSSSAPQAVQEVPAMLLEYAEHGTVSDQLRSCPPGTGLVEGAAKAYMLRVLRALNYLHKSHSICHRDLKGSNCLLSTVTKGCLRWPPPVDDQPQNRIYHLKLADLGVAKALTAQGAPASSTQVYTAAYRGPEMKQGLNHDLRLDTWLFGCLLLELRTGMPPFYYLDLMLLSPEEKEARRGAEELAREDCPYRSVLTPVELAFVTTCLERDVLKRPFLSRLSSHQSYRNYFWKP